MVLRQRIVQTMVDEAFWIHVCMSPFVTIVTGCVVFQAVIKLFVICKAHVAAAIL